jgi:ribonuclease Z
MGMPLDGALVKSGGGNANMRRFGIGVAVLAVVAVVVGLGLWLARAPIAMWVMARAYDHAMTPDPIGALPDGLHVGLCGSGSPMPDPTRAGPCAVVVAGHREFVIDTGPGSTRNLSLMNLPPAGVDAVFLTHFHSDHIGDLGELMLQHWAGGAAKSPLPIYGPTGVDLVVAGFVAAYQLDHGYRIAHHGVIVAPPSGFGGTPHHFAIDAANPNVTLIDEPDLKVVAVLVDHGPVKPAVGYLFVYKGRRVVISGDTVPNANLEAAARGADVLVHEGLAPNLVAVQREAALRHGRTNLASILHDILSYHTTPEQAAALAERAHARMLLFTHEIPPLPLKGLEGPFLGKSRSIFHGRLQVGKDGDFVSLPAHSTQILVTNRMPKLY